MREFASEVTRVSLEVGTEGKLGGVAVVRDVEGVWHELTVNVSGGLFGRLVLLSYNSYRFQGEPHVSKSNLASAIYCRRDYGRRQGECSASC